MKFYPNENGGGAKSFGYAEGGRHKTFWGNFYSVA